MPLSHEGRISEMYKGTTLQPRPYQLTIVSTAVNAFTGNYMDRSGKVLPAHKRILIESATGSGKTSMSLMTAKVLSELEDCHIIWVAMRTNLLGQAERENVSKGINANVVFMSMFDANPPEFLLPENRTKKLILVVDEAQHDAASTMGHLHDVLRADYVLGCTATPYRLDGAKLCFDMVIRNAGIHQLMVDGYLSQYHHYTVKKYSVDDFARHYLAEPEKWGKSIFYFHSVDDCNKLQTLLAAAGHDSEVVTGSSDRKTQLKRFADGEIKVLINCMVLTEGFDCPDLETVWCRDSGKGPTVQMCGRAFRPHPDFNRHGHVAPRWKKIVQSVNATHPMGKTAHPVKSFVWESEQWLSLETNPMIEQVYEGIQSMIANQVIELPKFIADRRNKKKKAIAF